MVCTWGARKKKSDFEKAQQLFSDGKVLEAAKLGLPRAQGKMAQHYSMGENGFEKDLDKCFEFAKLAAEGGDRLGQFWLGLAYYRGQGAEKDIAVALKWFELAAEQGCITSMFLRTRRLRVMGSFRHSTGSPPCTIKGSV
jgi:TPR repeat protein